jgi:anti-sigma factor ChrR (cupin superfamily)
VTSLVRYAPGGAFPAHAHPEGEEILVLEGESADEHGRYPEGTWIRSPHMSRHAPSSETGCLIYVRVGGLQGGSRVIQRSAGSSHGRAVVGAPYPLR